MTNPCFLVEGDGARVVGVDVEIEPARRHALGFGDQRHADARTPMLRRHHDLIEIERARIDGDEADHSGFSRASSLRNHDVGGGHKLTAPALPPPAEPLGEIEFRVSRLPGPQPQRDRGILVARVVAAQHESRAHGATASLPASLRRRRSSRCMVSLPATTWPLAKMSSSPSRSLTKPPASRTRIEPAAMSHGDRSRSQ